MGTDPEWLTWPQAAELIGCPVPTVDYNQRIGRIVSRPHQGSRPTISRESAEEFAEWYAARAAKRAEKAHTPRAEDPPEPSGWLTTVQVAELMDRTKANVAYLVRTGRLPAVRRGQRLWLRETDVRDFLEGREQWVSINAAANLVGFAPRTVQRACERGEIEQRKTGTTARASLSREPVLAWAQARRVRPPKQPKPPREPEVKPPDDEHVWIRADEVARMMGVSPGRVRQLANADRLPCVRVGSAWWFRRDLVSQVATARAALRTV